MALVTDQDVLEARALLEDMDKAYFKAHPGVDAFYRARVRLDILATGLDPEEGEKDYPDVLKDLFDMPVCVECDADTDTLTWMSDKYYGREKTHYGRTVGKQTYYREDHLHMLLDESKPLAEELEAVKRMVMEACDRMLRWPDWPYATAKQMQAYTGVVVYTQADEEEVTA